MKEITILLAAYKGNAYVSAMIDSILAQDCGGWQLILSDDGEDTAPLLEEYASRYPDRIRHHRSGRRFGSAQKHFLYLLEQFGEETPYCMFCDQDDVWHPDKVRLTREAMRELEYDRSRPCMVHTDLRVVDGELTELDPSFMHYSRLDGNRMALHELLVQNVVTGCTMMINRPLASLALKGKDCPEMAMHDMWIALCCAAFGDAAFLPEATMDYRQHGGNVVGAKNPRSLAYLIDRAKGGQVKKALYDLSAQAGAFLKLYYRELKPEDRELLWHFSRVTKHGKLHRIRTYYRYQLLKADPKRRLGQLIWW